MNLPSLDITELPGLESAAGIFGSLSDLATAHTDDRIVVIMVYVYEMFPPESLL
ncbi:hypothetical protein [Pontixanthobacter sp. CEM42]|uniref:hypothetical protein n=1 Tax=Pontixanthobacter sp. CEM42 TaxID=2792077 RepID=UPI001ADEEFFD|nr:hypothetical protein [Pontixanthobacter sp. CEM42]